MQGEQAKGTTMSQELAGQIAIGLSAAFVAALILQIKITMQPSVRRRRR